VAWHLFVADEIVNQSNIYHIDNVTVEVGIVVEFGGIVWRVLDLQDGRALLLSEYILEPRAFSRENHAIWEISDLRAYLNGEFYYRFAEEERAHIAETRVINCGALTGRLTRDDTIDKIFLLSVEELVHYFGDSSQLTAGNNNWLDDQYNFARAASNAWWLRTPAIASLQVVFVRANGTVLLLGTNAHDESLGVRPALWRYLDLSLDNGAQMKNSKRIWG